jgi:hypothetical protein
VHESLGSSRTVSLKFVRKKRVNERFDFFWFSSERKLEIFLGKELSFTKKPVFEITNQEDSYILSLDPIFARNSLFAEEDHPNAPAI